MSIQNFIQKKKAGLEAGGPKEIDFNQAVQDVDQEEIKAKSTSVNQDQWGQDEGIETGFTVRKQVKSKKDVEKNKNEPVVTAIEWGEAKAAIVDDEPKKESETKKKGEGVLAAARGERGGKKQEITYAKPEIDEEEFPTFGEEVKKPKKKTTPITREQPKEAPADNTFENKPTFKSNVIRKSPLPQQASSPVDDKKDEKEIQFGAPPAFKANPNKKNVPLTTTTQPEPTPQKEEEEPVFEKPTFVNAKLKDKPKQEVQHQEEPEPAPKEPAPEAKPVKKDFGPPISREKSAPEPIPAEFNETPVKFTNKKAGGFKDLHLSKVEEKEREVERELAEKREAERKEAEERKKAREAREAREKEREARDKEKEAEGGEKDNDGEKRHRREKKNGEHQDKPHVKGTKETPSKEERKEPKAKEAEAPVEKKPQEPPAEVKKVVPQQPKNNIKIGAATMMGWD